LCFQKCEQDSDTDEGSYNPTVHTNAYGKDGRGMENGRGTSTLKKDKSDQNSLMYGIDDVPPLHTSILLALQVNMMMTKRCYNYRIQHFNVFSNS
jgi:hypothetical protein